MANCKDCIHYGICTFHITGNENEKCPHYTPTDDVVPKSEYEQLKAMYEDNETQRAYTINMLGESLENAKSEIEMLQGALKAEEQHNELTMEVAQKALKNAKSEVAREIFEEIEKAVEDAEFEWGTFFGVKLTIAELKKKYTGEGTWIYTSKENK